MLCTRPRAPVRVVARGSSPGKSSGKARASKRRPPGRLPGRRRLRRRGEERAERPGPDGLHELARVGEGFAHARDLVTRGLDRFALRAQVLEDLRSNLVGLKQLALRRNYACRVLLCAVRDLGGE